MPKYLDVLLRPSLLYLTGDGAVRSLLLSVAVLLLLCEAPSLLLSLLGFSCEIAAVCALVNSLESTFSYYHVRTYQATTFD